MAKSKTSLEGYLCSSCSYSQVKFFGTCPGCGAVATAEEFKAPIAQRSGRPSGAWVGSSGGSAKRLRDTPNEDVARITTGMSELDRVLGGGIPFGGVLLLAGKPGIGKSTILTQISGMMRAQEVRTLYASAEERGGAVRERAERVNADALDVWFMTEQDVDIIISQAVELRSQVLIVDSMQTMVCAESDGAPGNVSQVKAVAARLTQFAKSTGCAVVLVGHVTRSEGIAGPNVVEHMVDTVLYFGSVGHTGEHRLLRSTKNRFGRVDEMAVFSMESQGLVEVESPSTLFLADRGEESHGAALGVWLEGSRPIGIEVEALVTAAQYGSPQRQAVGWPKSRLMLASAVLEKRCHLRLGGLDVFVNVSGGVDLSDPGFDLAVYAALLSSARNVPIGPEWAFVGEVSLLGGIRRVPQVARRVELAQRLGATRIVVPAGSGVEGKHVFPISDLGQLWRLLEPGHVEVARSGPEKPTRPAGAPTGRSGRSGRSEISSRRRMAGTEMGDLRLPD